MAEQNKRERMTRSLDLEVQVVEQACNPGCGSSSTSPRCTCPISASTTASLFTAKATR